MRRTDRTRERLLLTRSVHALCRSLPGRLAFTLRSTMTNGPSSDVRTTDDPSTWPSTWRLTTNASRPIVRRDLLLPFSAHCRGTESEDRFCYTAAMVTRTI